VRGFYLGRPMRLQPDSVLEALRELLDLWRRRPARPVIGAELPLDETEAAHELVESRRSVGKVVLIP